jgi:replicative DNA helicase
MIADVKAEEATLGSILAYGTAQEAAEAVRSTGPLQPEAFTGARRLVWEAMVALVEDGKGVDHLTVADKLKARGQIATVGGPAALMAFDQATPLVLNLPSYVAILRDRMDRRAVVATAETAIQQAGNLAVSAETTASVAATRMSSIRTAKPLRRGGELIYRLVDKWDENVKTQLNGGAPKVPCLPWPHEAMSGDTGIPYGRLSVVAGRSGNFKTGLVADGIWHWGANLKVPGGVIGLEDGCDWFTERLTAREVMIPYEQVGYARLHESQQEMLQAWCSRAYEVLEQNVLIEDYTREGDAADSIGFGEVFAVIRAMVEAGARWVVIDHGLRIDWMKGAAVERNDMAIGHGMKRISRYAERTGAAIVFLWHLNRQTEEGFMPKRSDLKESGYLDAEARKIYILWRQPTRPGVQLCTTVKATKGKEGYTAALPLTDSEYGLLGRTGGYVVDFEAEAAQAAAEREAAKQERTLKFGRKK